MRKGIAIFIAVVVISLSLAGAGVAQARTRTPTPTATPTVPPDQIARFGGQSLVGRLGFRCTGYRKDR